MRNSILILFLIIFVTMASNGQLPPPGIDKCYIYTPTGHGICDNPWVPMPSVAFDINGCEFEIEYSLRKGCFLPATDGYCDIVIEKIYLDPVGCHYTYRDFQQLAALLIIDFLINNIAFIDLNFPDLQWGNDCIPNEPDECITTYNFYTNSCQKIYENDEVNGSEYPYYMDHCWGGVCCRTHYTICKLPNGQYETTQMQIYGIGCGSMAVDNDCINVCTPFNDEDDYETHIDIKME